jgi:hypothetical protein
MPIISVSKTVKAGDVSKIGGKGKKAQVGAEDEVIPRVDPAGMGPMFRSP